MQQYWSYCKNEKCDRFKEQISVGNEFNLIRKQGNVLFTFLQSCDSCKEDLSIKFLTTPPWVFVSTLYDLSQTTFICYDEIPKNTYFDDDQFRLACCTVHIKNRESNHFCGIFNIDQRNFYIDDLITPSYTEIIPNIHKVSTCFYFLEKNSK